MLVPKPYTIFILLWIQDTAAWANSDRDYLYTELLERVFDIMRAKNPALVQGEKRRFVMKPPQVIRLGSKKSGFINFVEICKMMHRQPDHVLGYLLAELGTSGTLDGSQALVLKGRFQQKQMESVLRRYIRKFTEILTLTVCVYMCMCVSDVYVYVPFRCMCTYTYAL